MLKRFLSITVSLFFLLVLVLSITFPRLNLAQAEANSQTTPVGIPISRHNDGIIQNNTMGVFGPQICTAFGDPFSPWNSPWAPNSYTYRYQIRIPLNYPDDVVRVELFDPDSVNQADNNVDIKRTSFAIDNGLPLFSNDFCGSSGSGTSGQQRNPCVFETGETYLVDTGQATIDQINPFWFVRIDENRGAGGGNGDGTCNTANAASYEPRYNTETLFELYYYRQIADEQPVEMPVASYIGYVGDPARDLHGDHQTDLRWVSPGADKQGYDFPIADVPGVSEVPTTEGDTSFEVRLAEVGNMIVDPSSGDRFLYLDVTTLSGASENAYHIWAGPDDYVDTSATDVNERNLAAINNLGSHDSRGVQVEAMGRMTSNNLYPNAIDMPLADIPAAAAGYTISVSSFDLDSGVQPPITFFFDSIPKSDWSLTFADPGVDDPDGVAAGTRCTLGGPDGDNCNNVWTTPAYQINIPGDLSNCDFLNPTQADCTPFMGGRLMVDLNGGIYDTHAWDILAAFPIPVDTTQSCAAFPIAVGSGIRSVSSPGSGGNAYPDLQDFDYPSSPPRYEQFLDHNEGSYLTSASVGTLFKLSRGFSYASSNFGWLKWNLGITSINGSGLTGETAVLSNSLTWPGDNLDFADHADPGSAVADGYGHVVRGYVEPGDSTDQSMHVDDWVSASPAQLPEIATAVNTLIDDAPVLRMVVWDTAESGFGSYGRYFIERFALFKIIGYGSSAADDEWLLLEFKGFDDSCGQLPPDYDLTIGSLQIVEPTSIHAGEPFTVTATITNTGTMDLTDYIYVDFYFTEPMIDTSPPIADGSIGGKVVSGLAAGESKTIVLQTNLGPPQEGGNQLFVQVDTFNYVNESDETNNISGPVNFQALEPIGPDLTISDLQIVDPGTLRQDQPFLAQVTISNTGTVDVNSQFFVDFYLNPSQTDPFLTAESVGYTAVSSLPAGSQQTLTVTLSGTHQQFNNALYAMVDSLNQVTETDETNNVAALLNFDVLPREKWFIYLPFILTQPID